MGLRLGSPAINHGHAMAPHKTIKLDFITHAPADMDSRASDFLALMRRRRSVRDFSDTPVSRDLIEKAVLTAASAPSGANQQPWTFVCISDPALKHRIRLAAEEEERGFYNGRAGDEWLDALSTLGTDARKPFLDTAPWLIVIFAQRWGISPSGKKMKHYYVPESVGIATGLLIAALHNAGLATLTHTPAPMGFLTEVCGRPDSEKPVILLVVGHPAKNAQVPDIERKQLDEVAIFVA
jgi:iodotyrosine deiodinase